MASYEPHSAAAGCVIMGASCMCCTHDCVLLLYCCCAGPYHMCSDEAAGRYSRECVATYCFGGPQLQAAAWTHSRDGCGAGQGLAGQVSGMQLVS
jgi:hypothetical protein